VVSAGILKSGDRVIRLAGIRETALDRTCTDRASQVWPCGRFAKSSLARFVRARTLDCDEADPAIRQVETRCRISGQDLSQWLVRYGWAEPEDGFFENELALAQRENRGLWRKTRP
jgi:endonuclease YncB( thermonuclease family)